MMVEMRVVWGGIIGGLIGAAVVLAFSSSSVDADKLKKLEAELIQLNGGNASGGAGLYGDALIFADESGDIAMVVGRKADGGTGVYLQGKTKVTRTSLFTNKDDITSLQMNDTSGNKRIGLGVLEGGVSTLGFNDANGNVRLMLAVMSDGTPTIAIFDGNGKPVWTAP